MALHPANKDVHLDHNATCMLSFPLKSKFKFTNKIVLAGVCERG